MSETVQLPAELQPVVGEEVRQEPVVAPPVMDSPEYNRFFAPPGLEKFTLPEGMAPNDYLVAGNAVLRYRQNSICEALFEVSPSNIEGLPIVKGWCKPSVPKMHYSFLEEAIDFCRHGVAKNHGEVMLLLTLDENGVWGWYPPEKQYCSGANVQYTRDPLAEYTDLTSKGIIIVGTMHSHCRMAGFFSGTDDNDDKFGFDGIHMVFGKVTQSNPEMEWSITLGGQRYVAGKHFAKETVLDGIPDAPLGVPKAWIDTISNAVAGVHRQTYGGAHNGTAYNSTNAYRGTHGYTPNTVTPAAGVASVTRAHGAATTVKPLTPTKPGISPVPTPGTTQQRHKPQSDIFFEDGTCMKDQFLAFIGTCPTLRLICAEADEFWERLEEALLEGDLTDVGVLRDTQTWFEERALALAEIADHYDDVIFGLGEDTAEIDINDPEIVSLFKDASEAAGVPSGVMTDADLDEGDDRASNIVSTDFESGQYRGHY